MPEIKLILDNIRSTHNVGSIFRTADAAGVAKIYCIGTTPVPVDRFGRKRKDLAKVSLGAEESVVWEYIKDDAARVRGLIRQLKKEGYTIVVLEQDEKAVDYRRVLSDNGKSGKNSKFVVILGNEVGGVSKEFLKLADMIAEIPMKGKKESLNVSVATGIILFELLK